MKYYFGLDFGTANTVIQYLSPADADPQPYGLADLQQSIGQIPVIPSLIQFSQTTEFQLGAQINTEIKEKSSYFRWMKHYQLNRNPYYLQCREESISSAQAADTFIRTLLKQISKPQNLPARLGVSIPVDAYEHYENWLLQVCESFPFDSVSVIDEASAAAIGCGIQRLPGQIICVIDFGAGTLDVSIVKFEETSETQNQHQKSTVLAKSAASLGGLHIDQWLYEFFLDKFDIERYDPLLRPISAALLKACEQLKIDLSLSNDQTASLNFDEFPFNTLDLSAKEFEQILESKNFFSTIKRTLDNAMATLQTRGYQLQDISNFICVGGSSQMLAFTDTILSLFPNHPVSSLHAMDAVARGAALFASGETFFNHIHHDYAIRYYDASNDTYQYRMLVQKGTPYPSEKPLAEFVIKATYDQQQRFGLPIYEINQHEIDHASPFELFFDPLGAIQLLPLTEVEKENRKSIWLNESNPTFLRCNHHVMSGQSCLKVAFSLDEQKRLVVSSYDMIGEEWQVQNHPVIRLS
jgi:molecular chaperone DnaK (HSP70)